MEAVEVAFVVEDVVVFVAEEVVAFVAEGFVAFVVLWPVAVELELWCPVQLEEFERSVDVCQISCE
jgi:hypothetical protein